jgi:hypothetical protein
MNTENQKAGPVLRPFSGGRHMTKEEEAEVDSWYRQGHAIVRVWNLSSQRLWEIACDRTDDFFIRQGAYLELKERGYDMPTMLPVRGDSMPERRKLVLGLLNE